MTHSELITLYQQQELTVNKQKYFNDYFKLNLKLGHLVENYIIEHYLLHMGSIISRSNDNNYDIKIQRPNGKQYTFEVKCDTRTHETNNLAIEYKEKRKLSGISVCEADYWIHYDLYNNVAYVFPTEKLRDITFDGYENDKLNGVKCGFNNTSHCVLVPIHNKELRNIMDIL